MYLLKLEYLDKRGTGGDACLSGTFKRASLRTYFSFGNYGRIRRSHGRGIQEELHQFGFVDLSITAKIHVLDSDVHSGKQCMSCLNGLLKRLLDLDKPEWLEQTLVTRVYLTGKYPPTQSSEGVSEMRRLMGGTTPFVCRVSD